MPRHPLTNFEIQKYYQNEPKFNDVYLRNKLPKIKDGTYMIKLDEYESIGTHMKAFYVNANNAVYFDSFVVEHVPKEIKKFIGNKDNIKNVYIIQTYNSIMCGYFCIEVIDFMLKSKGLLDNANLFSPNNYETNDKIILKYFQWLKRWKNYIALFAVSIENLENLKYYTSYKKQLFLLFAVSARIMKKNHLRYQKFLV